MPSSSISHLATELPIFRAMSRYDLKPMRILDYLIVRTMAQFLPPHPVSDFCLILLRQRFKVGRTHGSFAPSQSDECLIFLRDKTIRTLEFHRAVSNFRQCGSFFAFASQATAASGLVRPLTLATELDILSTALYLLWSIVLRNCARAAHPAAASQVGPSTMPCGSRSGYSRERSHKVELDCLIARSAPLRPSGTSISATTTE